MSMPSLTTASNGVPLQAAKIGLRGWILIVGIGLAALAEAVASTALSTGRLDMIGDTHATPDEFAWLDVA